MKIENHLESLWKEHVGFKSLTKCYYLLKHLEKSSQNWYAIPTLMTLRIEAVRRKLNLQTNAQENSWKLHNGTDNPPIKSEKCEGF